MRNKCLTKFQLTVIQFNVFLSISNHNFKVYRHFFLIIWFCPFKKLLLADDLILMSLESKNEKFVCLSFTMSLFSFIGRNFFNKWPIFFTLECDMTLTVLVYVLKIVFVLCIVKIFLQKDIKNYRISYSTLRKNKRILHE